MINNAFKMSKRRFKTVFLSIVLALSILVIDGCSVMPVYASESGRFPDQKGESGSEETESPETTPLPGESGKFPDEKGETDPEKTDSPERTPSPVDPEINTYTISFWTCLDDTHYTAKKVSVTGSNIFITFDYYWVRYVNSSGGIDYVTYKPVLYMTVFMGDNVEFSGIDRTYYPLTDQDVSSKALNATNLSKFTYQGLNIYYLSIVSEVFETDSELYYGQYKISNGLSASIYPETIFYSQLSSLYKKSVQESAQKYWFAYYGFTSWDDLWPDSSDYGPNDDYDPDNIYDPDSGDNKNFFVNVLDFLSNIVKTIIGLPASLVSALFKGDIDIWDAIRSVPAIMLRIPLEFLDIFLKSDFYATLQGIVREITSVPYGIIQGFKEQGFWETIKGIPETILSLPATIGSAILEPLKDFLFFLVAPQPVSLQRYVDAVNEEVPLFASVWGVIQSIVKRMENFGNVTPVISVPVSRSYLGNLGVKDVTLTFDWFDPYRGLVLGLESAFLYVAFAFHTYFDLKNLFTGAASSVYPLALAKGYAEFHDK